MIVRLFVLGAFLTACTPAIAQDKAPELKTVTDKASYQIGMNIGNNLRKQGLPVVPDLVVKGLLAGLKGEKSPLTAEEMQEVFAALDQEMRKRQQAKAGQNREAGEKFLAANKAKDGVNVTRSGLQYIVVKEGTGPKPTTDSEVTTHYRGSLIDGTVFDGSYEGDAPTESDEPISFGVTQVIKGWTEALQMMKVGSHYRLFIPSELAYGANGPGEIGPNSVLIFDIYLLGVN
jgi:FKBP-type peptidyl-prolyl cis-trans isomerase FklB